MKDMNQKFKEYLRNEFIIERDGVKIVLTQDELRDLRLLEHARYGFYSLDWYADYLSGLDREEDNQTIEDVEAMMQDFYQCIDVADEVYEALTYDNSEAEKTGVEYVVDNYQQMKGMEARNEQKKLVRKERF